MDYFKSHFGCAPIICVDLWWLISNRNHANDYFPSPRPVHLLWTFLFLRCYPKKTVLSTTLGVDEKTVLKWIWIVIEMISDTKKSVVSVFVSIFYFLFYNNVLFI